MLILLIEKISHINYLNLPLPESIGYVLNDKTTYIDTSCGDQNRYELIISYRLLSIYKLTYS